MNCGSSDVRCCLDEKTVWRDVCVPSSLAADMLSFVKVFLFSVIFQTEMSSVAFAHRTVTGHTQEPPS